MRIRLLVTAAATLSLAAAVAAEPPKAPIQKAEQPADQRPLVVAAAHETAQPAVSDPQASAPTKPARLARVTTCRCGDQNPGN